VGKKTSVPGVLEVGSEARHKLTSFLKALASHCAGATSAAPPARLSAAPGVAAVGGLPASSVEGKWSIGHLVQGYTELFPPTRASGSYGLGDSWAKMTERSEIDEDQDEYLVCARSYVLCLQHALQELSRRCTCKSDEQECKESWRSRLAMIAAAAVHRGTEFVWADRVDLAASSGAPTGFGAANGDALDAVGLGGYQGYGTSGSLLETERAAAGLVLNTSSAHLKRHTLCAARVKAHLSLLCSLFGRPATEVSGVLQEDAADACEAGAMSGELLARLLAALVQARNPWIWGVHKEVAATADDLLQTLTAEYLARARPCASPLTSAAKDGTASPPHPAVSIPAVSPSRGQKGLVGCEVVARVMWQQCWEALEHQPTPHSLSGTSRTAKPTHVHAHASSISSARLKIDRVEATRVSPHDGGCEWEWAAAGRGAAFLRASSLLWLAAQLGHAEAWSENAASVWLGAALALLQQPTFDLKALGARLLVVLLRQVRLSSSTTSATHTRTCWCAVDLRAREALADISYAEQADRQDVRWNEVVLVSSLQSCLHHQHEPLLSATLEALILTVTTIDGDALAPTGPLGGGAGPLKVLHLLLDQGLRETTGGLRALIAQAVSRLYHHLGAHAVSLMGPTSQLGLSLLASGPAHVAETLSGLALLSAIVTNCWPRTHAYMRDIVQVSVLPAMLPAAPHFFVSHCIICGCFLRHVCMHKDNPTTMLVCRPD
jgi:hypothetical protein